MFDNPVLIVVIAGVLLLAIFGFAQRQGWLRNQRRDYIEDALESIKEATDDAEALTDAIADAADEGSEVAGSLREMAEKTERALRGAEGRKAGDQRRRGG